MTHGVSPVPRAGGWRPGLESSHASGLLYIVLTVFLSAGVESLLAQCTPTAGSLRCATITGPITSPMSPNAAMPPSKLDQHQQAVHLGSARKQGRPQLDAFSHMPAAIAPPSIDPAAVAAIVEARVQAARTGLFREAGRRCARAAGELAALARGPQASLSRTR